jgi:hypothetical protein
MKTPMNLLTFLAAGPQGRVFRINNRHQLRPAGGR